jgi:TetR/AcrR family transcriptional regulator, cholesterol catabolism regulator
MLVLGALNWAAEWWNPRRGSLEVVVRTAQSLVRHGLSAPQPAAAAGAGFRPRRRPGSAL